jgi:hypothetical protein
MRSFTASVRLAKRVDEQTFYSVFTGVGRGDQRPLARESIATATRPTN